MSSRTEMKKRMRILSIATLTAALLFLVASCSISESGSQSSASSGTPVPSVDAYATFLYAEVTRNPDFAPTAAAALIQKATEDQAYADNMATATVLQETSDSISATLTQPVVDYQEQQVTLTAFSKTQQVAIQKTNTFLSDPEQFQEEINPLPDEITSSSSVLFYPVVSIGLLPIKDISGSASCYAQIPHDKGMDYFFITAEHTLSKLEKNKLHIHQPMSDITSRFDPEDVVVMPFPDRDMAVVGVHTEGNTNFNCPGFGIRSLSTGELPKGTIMGLSHFFPDKNLRPFTTKFQAKNPTWIDEQTIEFPYENAFEGQSGTVIFDVDPSSRPEVAAIGVIYSYAPWCENDKECTTSFQIQVFPPLDEVNQLIDAAEAELSNR